MANYLLLIEILSPFSQTNNKIIIKKIKKIKKKKKIQLKKFKLYKIYIKKDTIKKKKVKLF